MSVKDQNSEDPGGKKIILFNSPGSGKKWESYPIKWYVDVVKIGRYKFSLGYCDYGKGTAFIAPDGLKPLFIVDVVVDNNGCSDSRWCLNLACPLNRANIEYLRKYGVNSQEDLQILYQIIKEIKKKLDEIGFSFEKAGRGITLFKKPVIYIGKKK